MKRVKRAWSMTKEAGAQFVRDDAMLLGAAIAYYAALSIPPLAVLLVWTTSKLGAGTQEAFVEQVQGVLGASAADAIRSVLESGEREPSLASTAGTIAIATLVFSATGVFAQLQKALNIVWNVKATPRNGFLGWLRKRFVSLGMIVTIGFLLALSFVVDAVLSALSRGGEGGLPGSEWLWSIANLALSLAVFVLLVAAMYKILPDVLIAWRDVWVGAIVTGVLLVAGKHAIGVYLGQASVGSVYGTAGSLIVLLVWVYFASLLVFFGAELTEVWARHHGETIVPDRYAEWRTESPMGARGRGTASS